MSLPAPVTPPSRVRETSTADAAFLQRWVVVVLTGAVILSTVDGLLLQRRKSFFTGGFLAVDHLQGAGDTIAFLVISLLVDAAVVGLIAALVMWPLCRARLRITVCTAAGLLAGLGLPLLADVFAYRLVHYLGDSLDLSLMFDLTGQNPREMFAVASSHLLVPGLFLVGAAGMAGYLLWLMHRHSAEGRVERPRARVLGFALLLWSVGLTAGMVAGASSDVMENGLRRKPTGRLLGTVGDVLTDIDRDGFGIGGRLSDPDAFSAAIFPYATDVPGNGLDEDGVGGDLPPAAPYTEPAVSSLGWQRRPDVVLVVLESFRADLVGNRYDGKPITPVLDGLAARGVSSQRAYSHNGYTAQSRHHIFSGRLADVRDNRTLVDDFKSNGYFVAYFSGQDESFGGPAQSVGFERADVAYDARLDRERRYSTFTTAGSLAVPLGVVQERIGAFLSARGKEPKPLFLYVNLHDTHFPYSHSQIQTLTSGVRLPRHRIAPDERDALWATYANTAANVDRSVGEILEAFRQTRGADPAVIVTADHGESLFDEGFLGHGYGLTDEQTRIPLIVVNLPMVVREPFGQVDLRDSLLTAMKTAPEVPGKPRLLPTEDRKVFQYLGTVSRPRQIAFLEAGGRIIYDFRNQRIQLRGRSWQNPAQLDGVGREQFLGLIHYWERMSLARRPHAANDL